MMTNPSIDRSLDDKEMDHIDHALGRPFDPLGETARNYFVTSTNSTLARQFAASPNWKKGRHDAYGTAAFHVTEAGRKALSNHLKEIKDPHKAYEVIVGSRLSLDGAHTMVLVDKSASAAKYAAFLRFSDSSDLSFRDFLKGISVRRANVGSASA
ncbi:hypothetical protein FB480_103429 [Agrobacterium vitis]|nr:hypothetical protein FB480_103429 [Agrobacterium vitis]